MTVDNYQCRFELKPGKFVYVPTAESKLQGQDILDKLKRHWSPPPWFYHFAQGGHVAAIEHHLHNLFYARLDIENFFSSVTKSKLQRSLKKVGFSFLDSVDISTTSTVRINNKFALPYGFVQSPYLASLVLDNSYLGKIIRKIGRNGFARSVYVDDILLSHPNDINEIDLVMDELCDAANQSSFAINAVKTQGPADLIEAFNINLSHDSLSIASERFDSFRSDVIANGKSPSSDAIISYVNGINSDQAERLAAEI